MLERAHRNIVGRYQEESGIGYVIAENSRINHQIPIPPGEKGKGGLRPDRHGRDHRLSHPPAGAKAVLSRFSATTWTRAWKSMSPSAPTASLGVA